MKNCTIVVNITGLSQLFMRYCFLDISSYSSLFLFTISSSTESFSSSIIFEWCSKIYSSLFIIFFISSAFCSKTDKNAVTYIILSFLRFFACSIAYLKEVNVFPEPVGSSNL